MRRDFLKELGIEESIIDKIMGEHGKTIEGTKRELETLKTETEQYKTQLNETQEKIKSFESMNVDEIKKQAQEWQTKYETDTKELQAKLQRQDYEFKAKNYLGNIKFTSDLAKKALENEFISKEFKYENDKFLGADDWLQEVKKANPSAFIDDSGNKPPTLTVKTENTSEGNINEDTIRSVMGLPPKKTT